MKRVLAGLILLSLLSGALGAGYWLGRHNDVMSAASSGASVAAVPPARAEERKILYYRDPMGNPDFSPTPKKDSMGMDYIPIYEDEESQPAPADTSAPKGTGRILYYRNPMGLPDTSPTPKKDSMGMDYIPVYEGEDQDDGSVKISLAKVQRLGVRTEPAQMRELARTIRAVGTIQLDESRLAIVTTKFDGYIEKLLVNTTGQLVRRGQPLMEVYSPTLVQAQQEYLVAADSLKEMSGTHTEAQGVAQRLVEGAIQRLRYLDVSPQEIERLRREGVAARRITVRAPANGIVLEKPAIEGMRFMPGELLLKTVDLSSVWLIAEVFEQDLAAVREGQPARLMVNAFPGEEFSGTVEFIYPTLSRDTRTARVRVRVPNPNGRLRADMYASVELTSRIGAAQVLAVPDSAVINSGTRQAVLVERGEGRYEPREVKIGAAADGYYEIRDGLKPDERVVVAANFLIDAESNLRAALRAFTPPEGQGTRK